MLGATLLAVGTFGWYFISGFAKSTLENELVGLKLGTPKLGQISFSGDGLVARNIEFFQNESDFEPWLRVGKLRITHPISQLLKGPTSFDEIELHQVSAKLDLNEYSNVDLAADFDLSSLNLPSDCIRIVDSDLLLTQNGHPNFAIEDVDVRVLTTDDSGIKINGEVGSLAGSRFRVDGQVLPDSNTYSLQLKCPQFQVVDGRWQLWPYLPDGLQEVVQADGEISLDIDLRSTTKGEPEIVGSAAIKSIQLGFPTLDLPLSVKSGLVTYQKHRLTYSDVSATVEGSDQIFAKGETVLTQFPIRTWFSGKFDPLQMSSLRRLVAAVPKIATGNATGEFKGIVEVESSTRTSLSLEASALSEDLRYGSVVANEAVAHVNVSELVFDQNQMFESVGGEVRIDGVASPQPIDNVIATFELGELNQQLELAGQGNGKFDIILPLSTVDDLSTWDLNVTANVPHGTIGEQKLVDVDLDAKLKKGFLTFKPIVAIPAFEQSLIEPGSWVGGSFAPRISVELEWPLVPTNRDRAQIHVSGHSVEPTWLIDFVHRQVELAEGESMLGRDESAQLFTSESSVDGRLNFEATLDVPLLDPGAIEDWSVAGSLENSFVSIGDDELHQMRAEISLEQGNVSIDSFEGHFESGGTVVADGRFRLASPSDFQLHLRSMETPLAWTLDRLQDSMPQLARRVEEAISQPLNAGTIAGEFDLNLQVHTIEPDEGAAEATRVPWNVAVELNADRLQLGPDRVNDLRLKGTVDEEFVEIKTIQATLNDDGFVRGGGSWERKIESGHGEMKWKNLPIGWLIAMFSKANSESESHSILVGGHTSGQLELKSVIPDKEVADPNDDNGRIPIDVKGTIATNDFSIGSLKTKPFQFQVVTRKGELHVKDFSTEDKRLDLRFEGQASLRPPFRFKLDGEVERQQLSRLFDRPSVVEQENETTDVSGELSGNFSLEGQLNDFDWNTNGELDLQTVFLDGHQMGDAHVVWNHSNRDWKESQFKIDAFDGSVEMVELSRFPERLRVEVSGVDVTTLTSLFNMPLKVSGEINGEASLIDWSQVDLRRANFNMSGASMFLGATELGDFLATAEYQNEKLDYEISGTVLGGKIAGVGSTELAGKTFSAVHFPFQVTLANASLRQLSRQSNYFRSVAPLDGNLAAKIDFKFNELEPLLGVGRVSVRDLKWKSDLLTRDVSIRFQLNKDAIVLDDVQADLNRGTIKANASIPFQSGEAGSYDIDVRQMDLARIAEIVTGDSGDTEGLFDARMSGQIGRRAISGRGIVGVNRASIHGISGQSMRVPISYTLNPRSQSGQIELRRTTLRLFDGNVSGTASARFGRSLDVDADLKFSNVDSGKLLAAATSIDDSDQGKLSGQLVVKGKGIRSPRDLNATFKGRLERSAVFQLPVIQDLANVIAGVNIRTRDYTSDEIDLRLNRGRIDVRNLNFQNSLVKIAITGDVNLDGRLGLTVAARVDRLNQPTLLDELARSPLARFSGTPVTFLAQAADFLSNRVVFLNVGGTFKRPQVRVDTGQQLREETIRYFLRGSQILPYRRGTNN